MRGIQSNILEAFGLRGLCLMLGFTALLFTRPGRCAVITFDIFHFFQQGVQEAGSREDGETEEGGQQSTEEAMAVHQLKFFSRTLSTGSFIIV